MSLNIYIFLSSESLTAQFERQVFGHSGGCTDKPQLTPKVRFYFIGSFQIGFHFFFLSVLLQQYEEECSKLKSVLETLEHNIKLLLKDYDSKKKV